MKVGVCEAQQLKDAEKSWDLRWRILFWVI